ncbi:MAG: PQQ-binding-like beta-propeller repeat protein [Gemmataceae bacterium]|nr:PQQ-like beta-propeller repeat protein [Gemmata sp.]MDW8196550.1 PQQ-binding-like beta-propeller repeat protein [Gemmataceae bacterium]
MVRRWFWVAVFFGSSCGVVFSADWPQFRGPGGQGISPAKGLPIQWDAKKGIAWKTELPGPGASSPVLFGERIFLTCYSGYNVPGRPVGRPEDLRRHLVCLDRKTGRILWDKAVAAKLPEQERIRDEHGYASSTPAVDGERVYCFFGKSGVLAFDHTGQQLWQADVGDRVHSWGSAASPVLVGDDVIVNASVESETLYALDKKSGQIRWKVSGIREAWNTPVVVRNTAGKDELIVAIQGQLLSFDPSTGQRFWNCDTDIRWYMVPSVVASEGIVYALGGRSGTAALAVKTAGRGDVTRTHRLWTSSKGSNVSSPVYHDKHLYFVSDSHGIAYCVEAPTGKVVYEERLPRAGQFYASALLADGKIYYLTRTGRVYVVAAQPKFELLATNDFNDPSLFHATPVAAEGRLFIRSDKYLYCVAKE